MDTVMVVGGAGYIGSHMVRLLVAQGIPVVVLDDLSTGHREALPGVQLVVGDLGDQAVVKQVLQEYQVVAVMHFAAKSLVAESVTNPLKYYQHNVAGTVNMLLAMQDCGVNKLIFSSTAAVYGEPDRLPIDEGAACVPTNTYGRSKLMVERILADLDAATGLRYASLRYFNAAGAAPDATLGESHNPESHLIPLVLQVAAGEREQIAIFGDDYPTPDGSCVRDYIHIEDLAAAHLLALQRLLAGGESLVANLGNGSGYSVLEILAAARRVTRAQIPSVLAPRRAGDPAVLVADATLAKAALGWSPKYTDLEQIIATAWSWQQQKKY